jgi:hypothetical protein
MKDWIDACTNQQCQDVPVHVFIHKRSRAIRGYCDHHFKENWPYGISALKALWYCMSRDEAVVFLVHDS